MVVAFVFAWLALAVGGDGKRVVQSRSTDADDLQPQMTQTQMTQGNEDLPIDENHDDEFIPNGNEDEPYDHPNDQYSGTPDLLTDKFTEHSEAWLQWRAAYLCAEGKFKSKKGMFGGEELSCEACDEGAVLINGAPSMPDTAKKGSSTVKNHCSLLAEDTRTHNMIIIRHGQSLWNKHLDDAWNKLDAIKRQVDGMNEKWDDSPLSQFGLRQSQKLADILHQADKTDYGGIKANVTTEDAAGNCERNEARFALKEAHVCMEGENVCCREEEVPDIEHKLPNGTKVDVSDEEMVDFLHKHPHQLDVLLGKKCSTTNWVTSQLTRAMDTFQIVLLPARKYCAMKWELDSDMQEFEHNADCRASTVVGETPTPRTNQEEEYRQNRMSKSFRYIESRYGNSDTERFTKNMGQHDDTTRDDNARDRDRSRFTIIGNGAVHKEMIKKVLERTFKTLDDKMENTVFGGHSIWFRRLLRWFGDQSNPVCKQLGKVKMANVGASSFTLRKIQDEDTPFALTDCMWIHLGSSKDFHYKPRPTPVRLELHELTTSHKHYRHSVPKELRSRHSLSQMVAEEVCAKRGAKWNDGDSCIILDTPNTRTFFSDSIGDGVKVSLAETRVSQQDDSTYHMYAVAGTDGKRKLYPDDMEKACVPGCGEEQVCVCGECQENDVEPDSDDEGDEDSDDEGEEDDQSR